jgi:polyferredoxin
MVWEYIGDVLRLLVLAGLGAAGVLAILIWKKNLATRVTLVRLVIQVVALAAIFYIFSYSSVIPLLYELLVLFAITLFLGRLFCGWLCPLGLIMDLETLLRRALKKRHRLIPDRLNLALHKSRYVILLFFLLTPIALWIYDPPINLDFAVLMAQLLAGPFRPYAVLLDPMIPVVVPWTGQLVIADINFSYPYAQNIIYYAGATVGQVLVVAFVA